VVAIGVTFYILLDEAGYKNIFIPFLAEGVKSVFGNSISHKVTELIKKKKTVPINPLIITTLSLPPFCYSFKT
jgi:hypothetical protein